MDLSFSEEQIALRDLARQILGAEVTTDRLIQVERSPGRIDRALWKALGRAGLAGAGIPEEHGGSGGGLLEICVVLEECGRAVAPVPAWSSMIAALAVARFGDDEAKRELLPPAASGRSLLTVASPITSAVTADGKRLRGVASFVPAAEEASALIIPTPNALFAVDLPGASLARQTMTSGDPLSDVALDGEASLLSDDPAAVAWLTSHLTVAMCATQLGVVEAALRLTASYTSEREQFGRKLGSFQAVQQRAADAYIDVEAIRWTTWQAAWRLSEGLPAAEAVAVAASWAADGGQRVLAATQHLHGGIGVDVEYPLHRYTLAGKMLELSLGGGTRTLADLGALMAR